MQHITNTIYENSLELKNRPTHENTEVTWT